MSKIATISLTRKLELVAQLLDQPLEEFNTKLCAKIDGVPGISRGTKIKIFNAPADKKAMNQPCVQKLCDRINLLAEQILPVPLEQADLKSSYEEFALKFDRSGQYSGLPGAAPLPALDKSTEIIRRDLLGTFQLIRPHATDKLSFVLEVITITERDGHFHVKGFSHQKLLVDDIYCGKAQVGPRYMSTMLVRSLADSPAFRGLFVNLDGGWDSGWFSGLMTRGMAGTETKDISVVSLPFIALRVGTAIDLKTITPKRIRAIAKTDVYNLDQMTPNLPLLSGCIHGKWYGPLTEYCHSIFDEGAVNDSSFHEMSFKAPSKSVLQRNPALDVVIWSAQVKDAIDRLGFAGG